MKILVVEPHAEVRALIGHVVERLGYEPVLATGRRGEMLPDCDFDVLLLEPADPGALSAAMTLRHDREELPIVCASIYPRFEQADRLRPVAYLVKPFGLAELEQALSTAVESVAAPSPVS